jgi:hypothetical protein
LYRLCTGYAAAITVAGTPPHDFLSYRTDLMQQKRRHVRYSQTRMHLLYI